jgi:hypothetical protein
MTWVTFLIAVVVFLLAAAGIGIGLAFGRGAPKGSCGGLANHPDLDSPCDVCGLTPDECPNKETPAQVPTATR